MEKTARNKQKHILLCDYLDSILDSGLPLPDYIKLNRIETSTDSIPEPGDHVLLRLNAERKEYYSRTDHRSRYQLASYSKDTATSEYPETLYVDNFEIEVAYFNRINVLEDLDKLSDEINKITLMNILTKGSSWRQLNESIVVRVLLKDGRGVDLLYRNKPNRDLINIAATNGKNGGAVLPIAKLAFRQFDERYGVDGVLVAVFENLKDIQEYVEKQRKKRNNKQDQE